MFKRVIEKQVPQFITEPNIRPGDLLPPAGQLAEDLGLTVDRCASL
jgi:hypothetical protein